MDAIGDQLFEIVVRTRDKVVMGPSSDPAEAQFRAAVTQCFVAVAWIAAGAQLARCKLAGDKPKAVMRVLLGKSHRDPRGVQIAIRPSITESESWRLLFEDADLYSQVWNDALTLQSEDATLAAGLRRFDECSLLDLASAEAYGE